MNTQLPNPIPVGQILGLELDARGWTQSDFATVIGRPTQFVSEIVTGKKEITRESAAQIGAAFGQTAEFWLNLQDAYLLSEQAKDFKTQKALEAVRRRARLNELAPISVLKKRKVISGKTLDELEAEIIDLFELRSIQEAPSFSIAARRSNDQDAVSAVQSAWVACIRRESRTRPPLQPYSRERLSGLGKTLPSLLKTPEEFRNLPSLFAAAGVSLVYVEALPGAKIDGCAFVLNETPVIGLSGRGKRLDKILFTLLHETAHVVLDHVQSETIVEALDETDGANDNEKGANAHARSWLLPTSLPTSPDRVSAGWVATVAAQHNLAPIVVIGQLQNAGVLDWRTTLARNAPTVTEQLKGW
ncbi:XRE family transcriptional regulator [Cryobacterium aureum]|uniref:XRE family transcriptional regulator n=1 Tax=Cryobacterium aureum TaxID=995037 RepID=UPI000CF3D8E5|nr:ImmA/IrrE family metallo-endopeptidase [Cryobacterium aureum]